MRTTIYAAFVGLALLAAGAGAGAQTVQKCVAPGGQVRYQSEPCRRGERTAEVWDAIPDAEREPLQARRASRRRSPRPAGRRAGLTPEFASDSTPDRCERARTYRDAAERRAGLARNYDLLSALQARVFEACR